MALDQKTWADAATVPISGVLAKRVSEHLQSEETALTSVLKAVRELHHSMMHMNGEEMRKSLESEAIALDAAVQTQRSRHQFRSEMANLFGVAPEQLTLTVLATKTSGEVQKSIVESRQRLLEMSTELNVLNRQNAAMIQQSLKLTRGIIGRLTKSAGYGEGYNSGGARDESHVGSLMEWGG